MESECLEMNNVGEGWIRGPHGRGGFTRIKRRKGKIGFTLSTRGFGIDIQQDMVKDEVPR